jgi:hypothetical protein
MSAAVRPRCDSSCWKASSVMFFFASAYAVSSSFWGHLELERRRLGEQDLLKDQIVEETQFPRERLFLRQRLRAVAHAAIGLVDRRLA